MFMIYTRMKVAEIIRDGGQEKLNDLSINVPLVNQTFLH